MKIALFKYVSFEAPNAYPRAWFGADDEPKYPDMTRVSEWVEIEFPTLPNGDIIAAQINALDAEVTRVTEEWHKKVSAIKNRKGELLALTHSENVA